MEKNDGRCATCRHARIGEIDAALKRSIDCHLNPPTMLVIPGQGVVGMTSVHPGVDADDSCSHFERYHGPLQ